LIGEAVNRNIWQAMAVGTCLAARGRRVWRKKEGGGMTVASPFLPDQWTVSVMFIVLGGTPLTELVAVTVMK
jgi:hypothetical protein